MEIDYNWFFAALAQCSAAIVGILGAFIIGDLLRRETNYEINKIQLNDTLSRAKKIKFSGIKVNFYKFNQQVLSFVMEKTYKVLNETKFLGSKQDFERKQKYLGEVKRELILSPFDAEGKKKIDKLFSSYGTLISSELTYKLLSPASLDDIKNHWEVIVNYIRVVEDLKHNCKQIHSALISTNNKAQLSRIMLILILIFFFIGVIFPLIFLPLTLKDLTSSEFTLSMLLISPVFEIQLSLIKCLILFFISILFIIIVVIIYRKNASMKFTQEKLADLRKYTHYYMYILQYNENQEALIDLNIELSLYQDFIGELDGLENELTDTINDISSLIKMKV